MSLSLSARRSNSVRQTTPRELRGTSVAAGRTLLAAHWRAAVARCRARRQLQSATPTCHTAAQINTRHISDVCVPPPPNSNILDLATSCLGGAASAVYTKCQPQLIRRRVPPSERVFQGTLCCSGQGEPSAGIGSSSHAAAAARRPRGRARDRSRTTMPQTPLATRAAQAGVPIDVYVCEGSSDGDNDQPSCHAQYGA